MTDAAGNVSRDEYDLLGRVTKMTHPLGHSTVSDYDANDNTTTTIDPLGRTTATHYDALDRGVAVTDPAGATTVTAYDAVGNELSVTDGLGRTTRTEYDALNHAVASFDALGYVTRFGYDARGMQTSATDPLGRATATAYDALGRTSSVADPAGGVTKYNYDAVGEQLSVTDAAGNVTRFEYDALGRVTRTTDPLGHAATNGYDAGGDLVRSTDRDGRTRTFDYDPLGRQTAEHWLAADGKSDVYLASYTFDAAGQALTAGDANSKYAMAYDADGRVTSVDNAGTPVGPRVVLGYSYDAAGQLTRTSDNAGVAVSRAYDLAGRLKSLAWSGGPAAKVEYARDKTGRVTGVARSGDPLGLVPSVQTAVATDPRGLVTAMTHTKPNGGGALSSYADEYDRAGQLTREVANGKATGYSYDNRGQLTAATTATGPGETHGYDSTGNRTDAGTTPVVANRPAGDADNVYGYDGEGNRTSATARATGEVTAYEYDYRNRLVRVTRSSAGGVALAEELFAYDVYDRLIVRSGGGQTVVTAYDGQHAWADYAVSGGVVSRYLYGGGADEILARWRPAGQAASGLAWYLTDRQGTVRDLTDSAGVVLNHVEYGAFGAVVSQTGAAAGRSVRVHRAGVRRGERAVLVPGAVVRPAVGRVHGRGPARVRRRGCEPAAVRGQRPDERHRPVGLAA